MSYFCMINLKLVKKICRYKLLNMDKTYDFVIKPLNHSEYVFFEIEIVTAKIVNSKSLKKNLVSFCRR